MKLLAFFFLIFSAFVFMIVLFYYYLMFSLLRRGMDVTPATNRFSNQPNPFFRPISGGTGNRVSGDGTVIIERRNQVPKLFSSRNGDKDFLKHHAQLQNSLRFEPKKESSSEKEGDLIQDSSLMKDISLFKDQLIMELRRKEIEAGKILLRPDSLIRNPYNIHKSPPKSQSFDQFDKLCAIQVQTMTSDYPGVIERGLYPDLPTKPLSHFLPKEKTKLSCAIVSSAGSMTRSGSGPAIDAHDVVLRFNDAPTMGFESDVGNKTTIRILNSKVLSRPDFNVTNPLFANCILLVWEPFQHTIVQGELPKMDHNFLPNYKRIRKDHPNFPIYILHPTFLWSLYDLMQESTMQQLPKTPPSSGFLGIGFLIRMCSSISAYEYIPSVRLGDKCHYYDPSTGMGCTFGDWHPLATEKLFTLSLNTASDFDLLVKGKASFPGCIH